AGVGKEVDKRARRRVVASDAKIPSEGAARDVEVAVGAKRQGTWRKQTAGADWVTSRHQQAERRHGREIERLDSGGVVVEHVKAVVCGVDLHVPWARVGERGYKVADVHSRGGVEALDALRCIRITYVEDAPVDGHARRTCQVS